LDGIRAIIERCRERSVRPIICSPAITSEDPEQAKDGFLQSMADEGLALARSLGAETVDVQRGMREVQRRVLRGNTSIKKEEDKVQLHVKDGIHLTDLGQLAMAYAILKGLGAPELVSSADIDAAAEAATTKGCEIGSIRREGEGLFFTRLDEGLPWTRGPFTALDHRWVPISDGLNRYMLRVRNLEDGQFEIRADGRLLGEQSAETLARGVNLSSMTGNAWEPGGPWDVQSCAVKELVEARDRLWSGGLIWQVGLVGDENTSLLASFVEQERSLVSLQRRCAQPQSYRFTLLRRDQGPDVEDRGSRRIDPNAIER
jgi:hypothetical protein